MYQFKRFSLTYKSLFGQKLTIKFSQLYLFNVKIFSHAFRQARMISGSTGIFLGLSRLSRFPAPAVGTN